MNWQKKAALKYSDTRLSYMHASHNAAFTALIAAALFGATTPLAKTLLGALSPFMVAGLFYLGSGIGLAIGNLSSGCCARSVSKKIIPASKERSSLGFWGQLPLAASPGLRS
jgi:hypothetical protein